MAWGTVGSGISYRAARTYKKSDGTRRGCLYAWGRGNNAGTLMQDLFWRGAQRQVADAGIPLVSSDYGQSNHWGNDAAIAAMSTARTGLNTTLTPKTDKVVVLAISLGATLACNWARQNPSLVAAMALLTPAVDINDIHDNNRNGYAADIESAYGGLAAFDAAQATHNPVDYAAASLTGIPIKVWYSTDDPVVTSASVSTFAAACGATTVSLGAVGHSAGTLDGQTVADFLLGYSA